MYKFFTFLILGFFACHASNKPDPPPNVIEPSELAKIKLTDLENHAIKLDTYKGKTIFINFWATWCKPCVEEMLSIEKAQSIMKDNEVVFLLASSEGIEEIKEFSRNHNYQFNYVHLGNGEALNLQALPTTFIFNPKGSLVFSEMGSRNWDENENINLIKNIINHHD